VKENILRIFFMYPDYTAKSNDSCIITHKIHVSPKIKHMSHHELFPTTKFPDVFRLANLARLINTVEIPTESLTRLEKTKDILQNNPDMSVVAYANHPSYNDPVHAVPVVLSLDPDGLRHWIILASYSHTDEKDPKNRPFKLMTDTAESHYGIEPIRVVQTYQIDNPKYPEITPELAFSVNIAFKRRMDELSKNKQPVGVIVFMEGTRSTDNGILNDRMEKGGIAIIGRLFHPTLYQPFGIFGNMKRGINLGKEYCIQVGVPYIQQTISDEPIFTTLIHNLADTLPIEKRGKW